MNATKALRLLALTEMKPFDKADWDAFAGCSSSNPLIGATEDYTLIVDNNRLSVVDEQGECTFVMKMRRE